MKNLLKKHCVFTAGPADIGYGLRPDIHHKKYAPSELDTAATEKSKVLSEAEGVTLSYLGLKAGDTLENKKRCKSWLRIGK